MKLFLNSNDLKLLFFYFGLNFEDFNAKSKLILPPFIVFLLKSKILRLVLLIKYSKILKNNRLNVLDKMYQTKMFL